MSTPTLHSLLPEADAIVLVALGLASTLERVTPWLTRAEDEGEGAALAPDDPMLLAALGLLSLHRTASRWLHLAIDLPQPARGASSAATPRAAELLR